MSNQEFNAAGKRVVVAGLGISGRSMAKILRDAGATVIGVDEKLKAADLHSFDDIDWDEVDLVCTSPVFNPRTPFIVEAQSRGIEVISEVEFALAACERPANAPVRPLRGLASPARTARPRPPK